MSRTIWWTPDPMYSLTFGIVWKTTRFNHPIPQTVFFLGEKQCSTKGCTMLHHRHHSPLRPWHDLNVFLCVLKFIFDSANGSGAKGWMVVCVLGLSEGLCGVIFYHSRKILPKAPIAKFHTATTKHQFLSQKWKVDGTAARLSWFGYGWILYCNLVVNGGCFHLFDMFASRIIWVAFPKGTFV